MKAILPVILALILLLLGACGESLPTTLIAPPDDLPPNLQEQFREDIYGPWIIGANGIVIRDTLDITNLYSDFTLTFEDTNYTTSGNSDLWPGSKGSWHFLRETGID